MSDRQEIIKVLAEKVMGDRLSKGVGMFEGKYVWYSTSIPAPLGTGLIFDPFDTKRTDNDALIEAFNRHSDFSAMRIQSFGDYTLIQVSMNQPIRTINNNISGNYTTAKKNEAVCMAIYEAVITGEIK